MTKTKHNYTAVPTAQIPEQDYFYYVTDEDKEEVLEVLGVSRAYEHSLGYNARSSSKSFEEDRISKYY